MGIATWKSVHGFPMYEVSSIGQIRRSSPDKRNHRLREMRIFSNKIGYKWLTLYDGEKYFRQYVHRVVAVAFLGIIPSGKQINHKDGNKDNNYFMNLEFVTPKENIRHAMSLGLRDRCKGGVLWQYRKHKR